MKKEEMYLKKRILMRPRVHRLLGETRRYPLCTVTAGTGYGKSSAVSNFLQGGQARHVWVQLTEMDNYVPRFWEITVHAVSSVDPALAKGLQKLGFPGTPELLYKCVKLLTQSLENGPRLYVVLDDFHTIEEPGVVRLVETLAGADIPNLSLFLISRQPLPLDYFSLMDNGLLHRLTEDDLRFTYEEMEAYYRLLGFGFSGRVLTNVFESTEGWPMALYLIGLHETSQGSHKKDPVSYTMPFLNSLFEVEVFSSYTAPVQDAFVKLSLLASMPLDIVKTISGEDFGEVYRALQCNMFASYNPSVDNQFVFHRLFRRFLKPRREALPEEERKAVYRLTAGWYSGRERHSEALDYYEKAGDYEGQWAVIQHYARQTYTPETAARCVALAEAFPPEFVAQNRMVVIHKGYMYLVLGRIAESARTFETLLESLQGEESPAARRLAGEAWLGLGPVRICQQNWEFTTCFENAAKLLPGGSTYVRREGYYLGNSNALRVFGNYPGALDEMARRMEAVWPLALASMNGCGSGLQYLFPAEAAFYRGRYEEALVQTHKALYNAVENGQRDIACASYYFLVRIYFTLGDFAHTVQYLQEMEQYVQQAGGAHAWGVDGLAQAWFYQKVEDFEAIPSWAYGEPLDPDKPNLVATSREKAVETDCMIRHGEYREALARLDTLLRVYNAQGALFSEIKTLLHKAVCLLHLGQAEKAAEAFLRTCQAAMPNNVRLSLVEEGTDTVELIILLEESGAPGEVLAWLGDIRKEAAAYSMTQQAMQEAYDAWRGERTA